MTSGTRVKSAPDRVGDVAAPSLCAVVLNYKNFQETIRCVGGLLRQRYSNLSCVIVDNLSPNDSLQQITAAFAGESRVMVMSAGANEGYAKGNNVGARFACEQWHPRYVLILNPDVEFPDQDSIAALVQFAERTPDAACVSPKVILPGGFVQGPYRQPSLPLICFYYLFPVAWYVARKMHQRRYRKSVTPERCFRTIGACMLLRLELFHRVGMFDEGTFLESEEPILAEKFKQIEMHFYHFPPVTVVHHHCRSGDTEQTLESLKYYFAKYRRAGRLAIALLEWSAAVHFALFGWAQRIFRFSSERAMDGERV